MIAYMCKYVPVEVITAFGTPVLMVEPHVTNFNQADTLMHPNMCSFVKAMLEDFADHDYEGMILTTCCDSSRRLYDTLVTQYPDKFFYCLDLPRKINDYTISAYHSQILDLIRAYGEFSGKTFDAEKFLEMNLHEHEMLTRKQEMLAAGQLPVPDCDLNICLAGARPGAAIKQLIEDHGARIALDLSCTGIVRDYPPDPEKPLESYASMLMNQIPCMRMAQAGTRDDYIRNMKNTLDGIIYHTVKFCDIYGYEYTRMRDTVDLPLVKLETDATSQSSGQILTRVEAFLEALRTQKAAAAREALCTACCNSPDEKAERLTMTDVAADHNSPEGTIPADTLSERQRRILQKKAEGTSMYVLGIDSGSTSTNAVIMNDKKEIVAFDVVRTGAKSGESADRILEAVLAKANLKREDIDLIVSTGYGRVSIPFADKNVTEISCHGKGAHFLNPEVRTILDIGGQDSKAIRLNENGDVIDFVMNDKCAAGTGRFLEMMARTLEISIDELGPVSLESKENIEISSMCSVFAESEVISLIAQNKETADIAHGIHRAISGKAISLMRRVGLEKGYMMTGGVAKNPGVVQVLEQQLGAPLFIYEEPEIVGAVGAAIYGLETL